MFNICEHCKASFKPSKGHPKQRFCCVSCALQHRYPDDIGLFNRTDVEDYIKKYILGLIITDGCIRKNGLNKTICISLSDKEMIEQIHDLICPTKKIYKDGNNFQVVWKNKKDIEYLESLNILERKTNIVEFPFVSENIWHLIRGVFDGDGCVFISRTHDVKHNKWYEYTGISFISGSPNFIIGFTKFLNSQDITYTVTQDSRHSYTFAIRIMKTSSVKKMYDLMYQNATNWKLDRKYNKFKLEIN